MRIGTDTERRNKQRKYSMAFAVGLATLVAAGATIAEDPSSAVNWVLGITLIAIGAFFEEKVILSRK